MQLNKSNISKNSNQKTKYETEKHASVGRRSTATYMVTTTRPLVTRPVFKSRVTAISILALALKVFLVKMADQNRRGRRFGIQRLFYQGIYTSFENGRAFYVVSNPVLALRSPAHLFPS
jgi:hypothetical protein